MKFFYASALALLAAIATAATLPELDRKTQTPVPPFCEIETMIELAKCSCFVESSEGEITDQMKTLCKKAFGEDLEALEGSCEEYVEDGKIDAAAVREDIVKANDICVPLLLENGQGVTRQIQVVEPQRTVVIVIVIEIIVVQC